MGAEKDASREIAERVGEHAATGKSLRVRGNGSKDFYGRNSQGEPLDVSGHHGIVSYEPTELVITARAGTPLAEIETALDQNNQMLAFEPPSFGSATLGGTIACGLSGPGRPWYGAARDFVLGTRIVNGRGEILKFGGEVMKNVAGYDVSRLMTGALGTLGVLLEISLKVLPQPARRITVRKALDTAVAIEAMNRWAGRPLPLSAACYDGNHLLMRLCGSATAVESARKKVGGDLLEDDSALWSSLREHNHAFFSGNAPLWRLSVPPATPPMNLDGKWLYDWGGAQRWLRSDETAEKIRGSAARVGGHAMLFRGGDRSGEVFHPLPAPLLDMHRNLKQAFDPQGILNPGRMYNNL